MRRTPVLHRSTGAKFSHDETFQKDLLALCIRDKTFLPKVGQWLDPSYFWTDTLSQAAEIIVNVYQQWGKPPTLKMVEAEIRKRQDRDELSALAQSLPTTVPDADYIEGEALEFCRQEAMKAAFLEGADLVLNKKYDDAIDIVSRASAVGFSGGIGEHLFDEAEIEKRMLRRSSRDTEAMAMLIPEIDKYLRHGGLLRKEMVLWLGDTSAGKSMALVDNGKASVLQGFNTVHYDLEMGGEDTADRYDAAISGIMTKDMIARGDKVRKKVKAFGDLVGDRLIVKEFPSDGVTIADIYNHQLMLRQQGFFTDTIILDYLDLVASERKYRDTREEGTHVLKRIKWLMGTLGVRLCTATQATRPDDERTSLDLRHVSENYWKVRFAHIVLAICPPPPKEDDEAESGEEGTGKHGVWIAKNRNFISKKMIWLLKDYRRAQFALRGKRKK